MKWILLILFALPNLAIGQAGQTEERNKLQTAWCEFAGVVGLIAENDTNSFKTKVLLGSNGSWGSNGIQWFDSLVIVGELTGYSLPKFNDVFTSSEQNLIIGTSDSLFLIRLEQPFASQIPDVYTYRYPKGEVVNAASGEQYVFTNSYTAIGSQLTRFSKSGFTPDKDVYLADSIVWIVEYEFGIKTLHHQDSIFMIVRWDMALNPQDTLLIPDSLGTPMHLGRFPFSTLNERILVANQDKYSIIVPGSFPPEIDTIYSYHLKSGITPIPGYDFYFFIDTVINDSTYLITIPLDGNTNLTKYSLAGKAHHISTVYSDLIITDEYSYFYHDTASGNLYEYYEPLPLLDTLSNRQVSFLSLATVHFCWGGLEPNADRSLSEYYPNPANEVVYYKTSNSQNSYDYQVEVFNINGSLVRSLAIPAEEKLAIPLIGLPTGMLLVHVMNGKQIETFKVIHY